MEKTCRSFEINCNLETDETKLLLESLLTKGSIFVKDVTLELLSSITNIAVELNFPMLKDYIISYTRSIATTKENYQAIFSSLYVLNVLIINSIATTKENYQAIFEFTNRLGDYSQVLEFIISTFNTYNEENIAKSLIKFGTKFAVDLFSSTKLTVNNENQVANVLIKIIKTDKSFSCALECLYLEWLTDDKLQELFNFVEKGNIIP